MATTCQAATGQTTARIAAAGVELGRVWSSQDVERQGSASFPEQHTCNESHTSHKCADTPPASGEAGRAQDWPQTSSAAPHLLHAKADMRAMRPKTEKKLNK